MSELITSAEVVQQLDAPVINGVDNANLLSVDSTEPIETSSEEVDDKGEVVEESEKKEEPEPEPEPEKKVEESAEEEKEEEAAAEEEEAEEKEETKKNLEESDSKKVRKRIGKLTKKMRTAERERDLERTKRTELEKELAELRAKTPDNAKPKKEDYEDEAEFIEALTDWKVDAAMKASRTKEIEKIEDEDEQQATFEAFEVLDDAIEKGEEKYPDFKEITGNDDIILSPDVLQLALDTDIPEDIMYHLASNPDESERISSLSLFKAAKEIGKIESELSGKGKETETKESEPEPKPPKKQSKAPEPITPVRTDGIVEKDPSKMSAKEYRAWREKK